MKIQITLVENLNTKLSSTFTLSVSPKVKDGGEFVADENISESEDDDDDDEGEESNDFFCLFCEYGPVTWCALKKHEKLNHPLKCMVCIKDCETKEHLRIHKLVKHGKECQLCRRTFIGLNGLKNHQRVSKNLKHCLF